MKYENFFYEKYKKDVFSQNGEDGVIEEILKRLNLEDRWCCEFGAWDGKYLSNTFKLIKEGYNAVLIEGDETKYLKLLQTSKEYPSIIPVNKFVNLSENTLDNILSNTPIPKDFSLLSIDIDTNDYQIWDSLKKYNPIVVVIEINSEIYPFNYDWIHDEENKILQTSWGAMYELGKNKDYEFVCHTGNMIFVRKDYFNMLNLESTENPIYNFRRFWIQRNSKEYNKFLSNN
jgi:hypothetical protein